VLDQCLQTLAPQGKNARIALTIAPDVPDVAADPQRLQVALANVIGNALNYSKADTTVTVTVQPQEHRGLPGVEVRVVDHGIGMNTEQLIRMYDAFYRAKTLPEVPGSGLGLAIFKEIIELHNATVEVDSAPGEGTVVSLVLPAAGGGQ
jgi:signal transduction histidine kinase